LGAVQPQIIVIPMAYSQQKSDAALAEEPLLPPKTHVPRIFYGFVRISCAYMDVWFLRGTFGHDERIKGCLQNEIDMINVAFEVKNPDWEEPQIIRSSFGLYLKYMLAQSVTIFDKNPRSVVGTGMAIIGILALCTGNGIMNMSAQPKDLGTFQKIEHLPIVPLILLLCTHIIVMMFAHKQLCVLKNPGDVHLPFPLTYTIFVGKMFMVLRMMMAYSSGEMGIAIDYFVWQELILTATHCTLSLFIKDPAPSRQSGENRESELKSYADELSLVFLKIIAIDLFKTVVMYFYWVSFQPGWIANVFDRVPFMEAQVCFSILTHAVLDMVQAAATMFTMFIGRFGRKLLS